MQVIRNQWFGHFQSEIRGANTFRIISPFIKFNLMKSILSIFSGNRIDVITRFNLDDFRSGVSDIEALNILVCSGANVQGIKNLHSKLYIFDKSSAIITSANLTSKAFYNNHEFGMKAVDPFIIAKCNEYFDWLSERGGSYLNSSMIQDWKEKLQRLPNLPKQPRLPDYGTDPSSNYIEKRYFVKFLGKSNDRVGLNFRTRDEIESAQCHYAVCFPANRGIPRRYRDGDIVYIARMLEGSDYGIFGKCEAIHHVSGRDMASEEEIDLLDWKSNWPIYIRVKNCEFIDGVMKDCPKMSELIDELEYECFEQTYRRFENDGTISNPWNSLRRQADVQLSSIGAGWLDSHFRNSITEFGKVDSDFIQSLYQGTPYE